MLESMMLENVGWLPRISLKLRVLPFWKKVSLRSIFLKYINPTLFNIFIDYDWKSGKYSTWTESTWRELSARIFLRPAKSHEALTLSIGFIVLIISFVLVFLVNSKSDILFGDTTSSIP